MRAVVQRCVYASVNVEGKIVGEISKGIMALVGFGPDDTEKDMDYILDKISNLRIFTDENDKMNLSVKDIGGGLLIVPNFTLYGDARQGRRPGYSNAAQPEKAADMFDRLKEKASQIDVKKVEFGIFQADMKVELLNDGPVTILLDSHKNF